MKENEGKSYREKVGKKRRKIIENRGKMQECQEKGKKKNERKGRKIVENEGENGGKWRNDRKKENGGMPGKSRKKTPENEGKSLKTGGKWRNMEE